MHDLDNDLVIGELGKTLFHRLDRSPAHRLSQRYPAPSDYPSLIWLNRSSRDIFAFVLFQETVSVLRYKGSRKAFWLPLSFSVATSTSPAFGTSSSPRISTGVEGPALLLFSSLSSIIALTLPEHAPAAIKSPTYRVPFCTRIVTNRSFPLSSLASMTSPLALRFGFAFQLTYL